MLPMHTTHCAFLTLSSLITHSQEFLAGVVFEYTGGLEGGGVKLTSTSFGQQWSPAGFLFNTNGRHAASSFFISTCAPSAQPQTLAHSPDGTLNRCRSHALNLDAVGTHESTRSIYTLLT